MLCASPLHDAGFGPGKGCNISVTLSDGDFSVVQDVSPRRPSFLENLIRRNPKKEVKKEGDKSPKWSMFSKKSQLATSTENVVVKPQVDKETAELIAQLELEGRSEADINLHLSYIHDFHSAPPAVLPQPSQGSPNFVSKFFREIHTAFKESFEFDDLVYPQQPYPEFEEDLRRLTVGISSAPFFGALPPDMDLTYEQLASLEPVYVGSKSVNNLPCCVHDGTPLPGSQTTCPVCLDDFTEGQSLKSLPCVHFFHKDCIDSWLLVGHSCPVCKQLVE